MLDQLAMGGYGAYVWTSFGIVAFVMAFNEWRARAHHKRIYRDVEVRVKALGDRQ